MEINRREWLAGFSSLGAGAILIGCKQTAPTTANEARRDDEEVEVTATEDLMREHGVLRRALLVYQESAMKLRAGASVPPEPLQKTAKLFRAFGEEYHEKKLEEVYIFPAVKKADGAAGGYADVLVALDPGLPPLISKHLPRRWKTWCECMSIMPPSKTPSSSQRGRKPSPPTPWMR